MKKTILHTIIAALMLLVIGGGVISVLDADWKDTAKKAAMSAAALGACWYPVSIAAQLAGASAESKVRALINGLILNRSIDYISLSLNQQAFIDTTCPDVANRTAFYTVALIGMSPAFYFVYKLLTKKGKPEPTLPTSWLPVESSSSSGGLIIQRPRPHPTPKTEALPQSKEEEAEYFNRYKQEKNLPADLTWQSMSEKDKDLYYYWRNWKIVTEK